MLAYPIWSPLLLVRRVWPVAVSTCTLEYTSNDVSGDTDMLEIDPNHPYRPTASSELSWNAATPGPCVPAESGRAQPARFRISPSFALRFVEPTSGVPDHTATRPMNAACSRAVIVAS